MNRATTRAVRAAQDHDARTEASKLLAMHAVNSAPDMETLDDVEALIEAAFAPKPRTFGLTAPEPLTTLRYEIGNKRRSMERACRWCGDRITHDGGSRYCGDACAREDLGEEPEAGKR